MNWIFAMPTSGENVYVTVEVRLVRGCQLWLNCELWKSLPPNIVTPDR